MRQINPKTPGSKSYRRYEHYKLAVDIADYFRKGARRADLSYDYEHGFMELPTITQVSMLDAHLALAHLTDTDPGTVPPDTKLQLGIESGINKTSNTHKRT